MIRPPVRPLVWLLTKSSTQAAAEAAIGDIIEDLEERRAAGRGPSRPALWVNAQVLRVLALEIVAICPRLRRSAAFIVRDAVRAIRAAPTHSLFVVAVLAAGITLGTLTFSIVDAVALKPLPVEEPEQLVSIPTRDEARNQRVTAAGFSQLQGGMRTVQDLAPRNVRTGDMMSVDGVTAQGSVTSVGAGIFPLLRLSPGIGRFWSEEESRGDARVAVLGHAFWRDRLRGDLAILGKTLSIDEASYTVIGVLSAASDHPELDLTTYSVWVPLDVQRAASFGLLARMRRGVTPDQVADEVRHLSGTPEWRPAVTRLHDSYVAPVRDWLLLALGAAILLLVVACANAANLMLTRSVARGTEMAIRASLGASRRQIAAGVLVEGLLLSAAATTLAVLLSLAGLRLATAAIATALPWLFRLSTVAVNGRVLGAAIACAVVTGVLCSLVPAWQISRAPLATLLKDDAPTATGRRRWHSALLTAEIATVAVLLVVASLFVVSLVRVIGIDLGIDRANLVAVKPRIEFRATVDEVQRRIERIPGVADVAVARGASLPLVGRAFGGAWSTTALRRGEGGGNAAGDAPVSALQYRVTSNYFSVAGLRFRRGGTWPDEPVGPPAVVLDEHAARALFGEADAIGRQVYASEPAGVYTVIGTVPHVYARGPEEDEQPSAYFPLKPNPTSTFAGLFVRTSRPADEMVASITRELEPVGPLLEEPFVFAADHAVQRITASRRFNAQLMSVFAVAALVIGAAGIYAVMTFFVAQQTREIGVRTALGATPSSIERGVLRRACLHLLAGLGVGLPVAWWLSRGFSALLFQVTPADVSIYAGVGTLLSAVGLLAAWIPARRAARIDPIICLRR